MRSDEGEKFRQKVFNDLRKQGHTEEAILEAEKEFLEADHTEYDKLLDRIDKIMRKIDEQKDDWIHFQENIVSEVMKQLDCSNEEAIKRITESANDPEMKKFLKVFLDALDKIQKK